MTTIRSFHNHDLPELLRVWIAHWSAIAQPPHVNLPRLEQAIASRTFFDPHSLLVAESEGQIVGWTHFLAGRDPSEVVMPINCVLPECGGEVAESLLTEALVRARAGGFKAVKAGVVRDERFGYAGLEPIGHGVGVPTADSRFTNLLQKFRFSELNSVTRMVAGILFYRPPVSREALQFRRSAKADSGPLVPDVQRLASGLSHIDIERFRLIQRTGPSMAEVDFWFSDPEAEVLSP
ncbi:MAG: hypothetical protein WBD31_03940, partial [Rubripirellula sp.]